MSTTTERITINTSLNPVDSLPAFYHLHMTESSTGIAAPWVIQYAIIQIATNHYNAFTETDAPLDANEHNGAIEAYNELNNFKQAGFSSYNPEDGSSERCPDTPHSSTLLTELCEAVQAKLDLMQADCLSKWINVGCTNAVNDNRRLSNAVNDNRRLGWAEWMETARRALWRVWNEKTRVGVCQGLGEDTWTLDSSKSGSWLLEDPSTRQLVKQHCHYVAIWGKWMAGKAPYTTKPGATEAWSEVWLNAWEQKGLEKPPPKTLLSLSPEALNSKYMNEGFRKRFCETKVCAGAFSDIDQVH